MGLKRIGSAMLGMLLILFMTSTVMASTTGKIAGQVIASDTGAPLPGANIVIVGSTMGAASNLNGNYTILNVPPGTYEVKATVIGYAAMTVGEVRVMIDQTARVDFSLSMEALEGETISIVAEKKVVKEDVATSVASLNNQELEELPMDNISDVVGLQAGVEDGLSIRGGGAEEALFLVDGVTMRDPRTNQPVTGIALSAVQEVSIERGGFNAEYGQVRSGIVNVVTKEGSKDQYQATATVRMSPPGAKYFGTSPFDPNSAWLRPYLDPDVCWTGTNSGAWDEYTQYQYPSFEGWNSVSQRTMTDTDPDNDLTPAAAKRLFEWQHRRKEITDQPDINIDAGLGGPVPFIGEALGNLRFYASYRRNREMLLIPLSRDDYVDHDWTLQLTSDITESMKLKISALSGGSSNVAVNGTEQAYSTHYVRSPLEIAQQLSQVPFTVSGRIFSDGYYGIADVNHRSLAAKLTHMLNPSTYYEASLEYFAREYNTGPKAERDYTEDQEYLSGYFTNEAPFGWSPYPHSGIDGMIMGGHTGTARDNTTTSSLKLKVDFTSQVDFNNLVKTGLEVVYSDLNFDYGVVNQVFPESNTYVQMNKAPLRGAFYIQDKLEMKGFIVNAGLRLDYHNANTEWVTLDPFDLGYFSSEYTEDGDYKNKKSTGELALSPRLSISHPITVNSKLFFNYGHFQQLPTYEQMFQISRNPAKEMDRFGNPNLAMSKTISYELGFDQSLFDAYLIQLAGFYHDITDQPSITQYQDVNVGLNYVAITNNSYEDIRGVELTLRKTRGRWWTCWANYTYQVNTSGQFGRAIIYKSSSEQRNYDRQTRNLYQNRPIPQPYARASVSLFTPPDFGPEFMGTHWLADWKFNFIGDWREGYWLTWNPRNDPSISQNVQAKDYYNLQLRIAKTFSFKELDLTFMVDFENVLNTKRLSLAGFYDGDDYRRYFDSLHLPENEAYDNIVGDDRAGAYRKEGVAYQPVEQVGNIGDSPGKDGVFYYENSSGRWMEYVNGAWSEVEKSRINKMKDDKAYIDMPNMTSFNFLNPRRIFFGVRASFKLN